MNIGKIDRRAWDARLAVAGLAAALAAALVPVYRLQGMPWHEAVPAAIGFVASCIALGSAVWFLLTRSAYADRIRSNMLAHALIAAAFGAAWTLTFAGLVQLYRPGQVLGFLRGAGVWQFFWGVVIYAALAALARAQWRLAQQQAAALDAELAALRAQLNPHFLFNTLHSLAQLAREDAAATAAALERFGDLMRYVLAAGRVREVPLEDELAFVRDYLALQRLRLADRLRVIERIDEDALDCALPPLLLQPLVENAVRHGIAPLRAGGCIEIAAALRGDELVIEIADDGAGCEPHAWRDSQGLGLKAVSRLLQALDARDARLEVLTARGAGFKATLRLPARIAQRNLAC